jgi:hypothetical protein
MRVSLFRASLQASFTGGLSMRIFVAILALFPIFAAAQGIPGTQEQFKRPVWQFGAHGIHERSRVLERDDGARSTERSEQRPGRRADSESDVLVSGFRRGPPFGERLVQRWPGICVL